MRAMLVRSSNLARDARGLCRDFFVGLVVLRHVGNPMKPTRAENGNLTGLVTLVDDD